MEPTDRKETEHFIQPFQLGEEKAFDFFFRQYYSPLCFFANTILKDEQDAKDIVQDCFTKLWGRHTIMTSASGIKSFLYIMVKNACIDAIRKKRKDSQTDKELELFACTIENSWLDHLIQAETISDVFSLINSLPPKMQQVFKLFYIEGKNYQEIADDLHTSPETVRKQRARALALIREKLLLLVLLTGQF